MASPFRADLLAGRTALVTGGGTGIGRAIALELAGLGCRVAVAGRRPELLAGTVELATAAGGEALALPCDVRDPDQATALVEAALSAFDGRLDVLVNNAGGQFAALAEDISLNGFRAVTRLNLDAVWHLSQLVATRAMLPAGYGKIVTIVLSPRRARPGFAHAQAARAAVESLARTLAVEWGPRGVRVTCVAPGIIGTEALAGYGAAATRFVDDIPLGRLGRPEEIAAAVAYLVSPAGDYVSGTTLVVDGGLDDVSGAPAVRGS